MRRTFYYENLGDVAAVGFALPAIVALTAIVAATVVTIVPAGGSGKPDSVSHVSASPSLSLYSSLAKSQESFSTVDDDEEKKKKSCGENGLVMDAKGDSSGSSFGLPADSTSSNC
ncbi:hypothetical protein CRG98_020383 [Punica granatum]|uniref:Uncharacterized protein n=1 Tax=Punica granatum TaxID=22663 RepID=A0A2I0JTJ4_PUNGR|nr:hypothetical protein CRG98_020383 [Punica granatum]